MDHFIEWLDRYWLVWPVFIIAARVTDVAMGTMRTIFVVRGHGLIAAMLGFFEILIWVTVVSGVLVKVTAFKLIYYALGFALGTIVGIFIERRLGIGAQLVVLVSRHRTHAVAFALRLADYIVTEVPAHGRGGEVALCMTAVPRRQVGQVLRIARHVDDDVHAIVEDIRHTDLRLPKAGRPFTGWSAIVKKK